MTTTTTVLAACDLRPGPWPPAPRTCAWCGTPLPPRHRRWCTQTCSDEFTRQHNWGWARAAALERDHQTCVRCGTTPSGPPELCAWWAFVVLWCQAPGVWHHAHQHPDGYQAGRRDWERRYGYGTPHHRADEIRWAGHKTWALEVNHKVPILGRHHEFGCHHHLAGLETLCHGCHLQETARQFGHRTAPQTGPTLFDEVVA